MAGEYHDRGWVWPADVEKFDIVISSSCQVTLVRRNAKAIYLGIGMLDSTMTYAGESFPKPNRVVVASCEQGTSVLLHLEEPSPESKADVGGQDTCAKDDTHDSCRMYNE